MATSDVSASVGFRSERGPILISLMLSTSLVALDSTIVATAVPVDRRRSRRLLPVPLAVLGVPAGAGGLGAGLREAGRHVRPQADHAVRDRAVPARLDPVRVRLEHAGVDRVPRRAGSGRRRGAADEHHHRRRHLHPRRAGQGAGLPGQRVGDLGGGRADPGRGVRAVPDLALDLLRQHSAVRARRVDADPPVPRAGPAAGPAADRLPGQHQPDHRLHPADPRPARGRAGLGLELADQHRDPRRRRVADRRVRRWCSGEPPNRCCRCGCSPAGCCWPAR